MSLTAVIAGFLWPWWPLAAVGIALAALSGRAVYAVGLGLLLDIAWGAPGLLGPYLAFPFSIGAVVLALVQRFTGHYFLDRTRTDRL